MLSYKYFCISNRSFQEIEKMYIYIYVYLQQGESLFYQWLWMLFLHILFPLVFLQFKKTVFYFRLHSEWNSTIANLQHINLLRCPQGINKIKRHDMRQMTDKNVKTPLAMQDHEDCCHNFPRFIGQPCTWEGRGFWFLRHRNRYFLSWDDVLGHCRYFKDIDFVDY